MAKASMDMIKDVLKWSLEADQKLSLIRQIVEGVPAGPAVKDKVAQKAPAKQRKAGRRRPTGTTRKVQLWAECKKADPEKVKSLSYRSVKTADLEKFLAKARKAKELQEPVRRRLLHQSETTTPSGRRPHGVFRFLMLQ